MRGLADNLDRMSSNPKLMAPHRSRHTPSVIVHEHIDVSRQTVRRLTHVWDLFMDLNALDPFLEVLCRNSSLAGRAPSPPHCVPRQALGGHLSPGRRRHPAFSISLISRQHRRVFGWSGWTLYSADKG